MDAMQVFWIIALVSSGLFLVQFLMSVFMGDIDVDLDGDATVDTDVSSIISFKGLTHFGIGFGWSMVLAGKMTWLSLLVAVVVGLVFMFVLWKTYKFAYSLQKTNYSEKPEALVGREATIYVNRHDGRYIVLSQFNGAKREFDVISVSGRLDYATGEHVTIEKYEEGKYYIA